MILGKSKKVTITSSKGKTTDYQQISFIGSDGKITYALLTEREVSSSLARAEKNIDNVSPAGLLDKLVAFILRLF